MSDLNAERRIFLRNSAIAVGALAAPVAFTRNALLPTYQRQEWQVFKTSTHYNALINAIRTMKANTNASDPASWAYWVNIHLNRCTHGVPYFLGWHRGYLYHFEKQLRLVSGDSGLVLPYWDYYSYATLPAEFTNPVSSNPLYVDRVNTNVKPALSMAPFSSDLINFQTGKTRAFEPSVEGMPHNTLHNLIGGAMADMQSPIDPIFWLHHANVDRLWVAWVAAGAGRKMPVKSDSYWSGSYIYTSALTLPRRQTYDTRTNLAYYYQNETMPTTLPSLAAGESVSMLAPPAVGTFKMSNPRATGASTFSAAGALHVELDERSVSVQLPASSDAGQAITQVARGNPAAIRGAATIYKSVQVVLNEIAVTSAGGMGGYFYKLYVNVPARQNSASATRTVLIGTLGPFQIKAAMHNQGGGRAKLRYFVTRFLGDISVIDVGQLTVSFERVNGDRSPSGTVMEIGEVRIELSTEEDQS